RRPRRARTGGLGAGGDLVRRARSPPRRRPAGRGRHRRRRGAGRLSGAGRAVARRRRGGALAPRGDLARLSRSDHGLRRLRPCVPGRGRHCAPVTQGRFITFEGGEGTGKSTQAARLVEALRARDLEVLHTREPGGSEGAEEIRNLALNGDAGRWSAMTETLLMFAARSDHLERTIRPALEAGRWVVCDR